MKIVCIGDSNTWGYDPRGYFGGQYDHPWPELLAEKLGCTVVNRGMNGRMIPGGAVDVPADTDLLIIMLGTNDLLQLSPPEAVCGRMERFLGSLSMDRDRILLIAPPPMEYGDWVPDQRLIDDSIALSKAYQELSALLVIRFADSGQWNIPLAYDGVHLTEGGHCAFAEALFNYLNKGE